MTLDDCRRFYAQEISFAAGITSQPLLDAFAHVPRENFLGPAPWHIGVAGHKSFSAAAMTNLSYISTDDRRDLYHNVVVALDRDREINNGQPGSLAYWIDALNLHPGSRVFHLGCGAGYYTAIIVEVVGPAGSVIASDVHQDLARRAAENLVHYPNVTVHSADGASLDPGGCDAILINAGVTHPLPLWLDRLRPQASLVFPLTMPINPAVGHGLMLKVTRQSAAYSAQILSPVAIFSCTAARNPQLEPLLTNAFKTATIFKLQSLRRDAHEPADTCLLHLPDICFSATPSSQS